MIKKYMVILMCILMFSLTACGTKVQNIEPDNTSSMFVLIEGNLSSPWHVVYHKETKVMYAVSTGAYNNGNFTVLVNPDGTPMIWEEE